MNTKRCFKCLCEKPFAAFYKHAAMADGHLGKCIECTKKDVAKHRVENLERVRAYDKTRSSATHRIAAQTQRTAEYREQFPKRVKANAFVGREIRAGRLEKQPCFVCGGDGIAHHPDYDRPLDVVWLCQSHHKEVHLMAA